MGKNKLLGPFLILLLALSLFFSTIQETQAARLMRYILPGENIFPEGVAYQKGTDNFYVSSSANGTIFKGDLDKEVTTVFLPGGQDGRTSATGMKVSRKGHLFISGGATGKMFVYDIPTKKLIASFTSSRLPTSFVNDVIVTPDGTAYFTDSVSPVLYRVKADKAGQYHFEEWLNFTNTPLVYTTGFNVNGIETAEEGEYLVVVQSNTGKLFRIEVDTKKVREIGLGGPDVTVKNGDGLLLRGNILYVVRNSNQLITKIKLSEDFKRGRVLKETSDPSFDSPTTIALAKGRLLVVNSQFFRSAPAAPFTVSSIKVP
ncbi:MAG: hypothetical protein JWP00_4177 [Chloroflexi bacterium]|nr:hypothetical protein [Chloroflexota bacterium]